MIPIVSVIGKDKEAKTAAVTSLVGELKRRGYRVGTIKHHAHGDFSFDVPGKASYRHGEAGAIETAVSGPTMMGYVRRHDRELSLTEVTEFFSQNIDVIVTEGYLSEETPKVTAPVSDIAETVDEIESIIKKVKGDGRE
ncbi:MAG: molybdopterin-guanine dinucleotide biosynthesis protein B [Actinomycetota bacterium]